MEHNVQLKAYNTFGLEVQAANYSVIRSTAQLQQIIAQDKLQLPVFVLGGGSNILFTKDYTGTVLHNQIEHFEIIEETDETVSLRIGGGNNWHQTVLHCVQQGWGGIENLSLIPGSVGAAPIQNIGAYGAELEQVLKQVYCIDLNTGQENTFSHAQCQFGYRDSIFKRQLKGKVFITYVEIQLSKTPKINMEYGDIKAQLEQMQVTLPTISHISKAIVAIRESKLPNPRDLGNCGSFFKNPVISETQFREIQQKHPEIKFFEVSDGIKVPAGWLIEKSGLKGKQIGNVGMHAQQALVLVNYGHASGTELLYHAQLVQTTVFQKFGIHLEMEVNIW